MSDAPARPALALELERLRAAGGALGLLEAEEVERLAADLEPKSLAAGETLLRVGDAGDAVFVVLDGRLEVLAPTPTGGRATVATLGPGELVGEVALVIGGSRTADVRALEPARVARLSRARFDELLAENPSLWRRVIELVLARLRRSELLPKLDRLFGPLSPELASRLEAGIEPLALRRGATLFERGGAPDSTYLVLHGRLRAAYSAHPGQGEATRGAHEAGAGELVGEASLLSGEPRSATLYAARDSELVRIPRALYLEVVGTRPAAALDAARRVVARSRPADAAAAARGERRAPPARTLAIVPASRATELEPLVSRLASRIDAIAGCELHTSESVDAELGRAGIAQALDADPAALRLTRWLAAVERREPVTLYRADRAWTPWSARAVGRADEVVIVADAAAAPEPGDVEQRLAPRGDQDRERAARRTLLLVHPEGTVEPTGTAARLAARDVDEVYHLRRDHPGDLARVARLLAGRGIGLVVGGGGARGFAHLGVIRALEELGVPIDLVGGASIGATMAFPLARGLDARAGQEMAEREFSKLLDYTLPVASLLSGRRTSRAIERSTEGLDIEDLWRPYFCVSTNLTTAESRVHTRGELARAMRASVSIPGVFPPVVMGDALLVDGGLLNNLPIDVMRARNPHGPVLAIDVSPPRGPVARKDFGLSVSGWGLMGERLLPWRRGRAVPAIAATLLQSQIVAANRARQEMLDAGLADFYRNIHVKGVSMLDFDRVREVAELGYLDALAPLRDWLATGALERVDGS